MNDTLKRFRAEMRKAVADYISSEGCDCCRGQNHEAHKAVIAKLLRVPKYTDSSGYNFQKYRSES